MLQRGHLCIVPLLQLSTDSHIQPKHAALCQVATHCRCCHYCCRGKHPPRLPHTARARQGSFSLSPRADTLLPAQLCPHASTPIKGLSRASCPLHHRPPVRSGKHRHRLSPVLPPRVIARSPRSLPSSMCRSRSTALSRRCSRNHQTCTSFTRAPPRHGSTASVAPSLMRHCSGGFRGPTNVAACS
jgi:hypothetical protein